MSHRPLARGRSDSCLMRSRAAPLRRSRDLKAHTAVSRLCLDLERRFAAQTLAKLFITPGSQKGYAPHFGCASEPSVHLSIGIQTTRVADLLVHAIQTLTHSDSTFRLPLGAGRDGQRALGLCLKATLDYVTATPSATLLADIDRSNDIKRHDCADTELAEYLAGMRPITLDSILTRSPSISVWVDVADTTIRITASSSSALAGISKRPAFLESPAAAHEDVRKLLDNSEHLPVKALNGTLDEESRLLLARTLALHGFLRHASRRESSLVNARLGLV